MATAALIPVSEYLRTTYRPDRDYIDGELKERNVGEQPHGDIQIILGTIFRNSRLEWGVRPLGDTRLQITSSRYRIPDLMVLRNTDPKDGIIRFVPLLCVEIMSKGDRLNEICERVADYVGIGTKDIWVIDPWKRVAYEETSNGLRQLEDGILRVQGTSIEVSLADIFAQLDEF
ncbi:MAG TPA: Uma2 family endonuclease [Acidobacteriaceae bacterium]|nr:Uma2 family endonuclease [Acidobacteriaceae bacterium]